MVMFLRLSVILFTGVCGTPPWDQRQTPPGRHPWQTHPLGRHPPPPGRHPPGQTPPLGPEADTSGQTPPSRHTSLGRHPLGRHLLADTPLPSACWDTHKKLAPCPVHAGIHSPCPAQCMLGYGQQAGGTHPTGMHSCFAKSPRFLCFAIAIIICILTQFCSLAKSAPPNIPLCSPRLFISSTS